MARPDPARPLGAWIGLPLVLALIGFQVWDERPILAKESAKKPSRSDGAAPFALLELFTSEGCSSCPPADALVGEVAREARKRGQRVFTLAYHVDYWDRLGHRDPHGSKQHSQRQRRYAKALGSRSIYTPQSIVNGREQFVGHSRRHTRAAIKKALAAKPQVTVALARQAAPKKGSSKKPVLRLKYTLKGARRALDASVLRVALVERETNNSVKRGENAGRRLRHHNVVRALASVRPTSTGTGEVSIEVPKGLKLSNAALIGYVQDRRTMRVLGANQLDLASRP